MLTGHGVDANQEGSDGVARLQQRARASEFLLTMLGGGSFWTAYSAFTSIFFSSLAASGFFGSVMMSTPFLKFASILS